MADDTITLKVFIETKCICDHSTTVDIPAADLEGLSEAEREAVYKEYAEAEFYEACNYGWDSESANEAVDKASDPDITKEGL